LADDFSFDDETGESPSLTPAAFPPAMKWSAAPL
jgi:hypothetical protein